MRTWPDVEQEIRRTGKNVSVPIGEIVHPKDAGAAKSVGLPKGQKSDWRFPPNPDGSGLHAREYEGEWVVHVDRVHPKVSGIRHLASDAPALWLLLGTAAGAAIGATRREPFIGAMGGLLAAAIVAGVQ